MYFLHEWKDADSNTTHSIHLTRESAFQESIKRLPPAKDILYLTPEQISCDESLPHDMAVVVRKQVDTMDLWVAEKSEPSGILRFLFRPDYEWKKKGSSCVSKVNFPESDAKLMKDTYIAIANCLLLHFEEQPEEVDTFKHVMDLFYISRPYIFDSHQRIRRTMHTKMKQMKKNPVQRNLIGNDWFRNYHTRFC